MPVTAIKIPLGGKDVRIQFITHQDEVNQNQLVINAYVCDENFVPGNEPVITVMEIDEETYHRTLRKDANLKSHFVKEFSTDEQWNP